MSTTLSVDVRSMEEDDLMWLVQLLTSPAFQHWISRKPRALSFFVAHAAALLDASRTATWEAVIACMGNGPCGYGAVSYSSRGSVGFVEFGVAPSHVGQGIGGSVLNKLVSLSHQHQTVRQLRAECFIDNIPCRRLLLSRGFRQGSSLSGKVLHEEWCSFSCYLPDG